MKLHTTLALLGMSLGLQTTGAQSLKLASDNNKAQHIFASKDTVVVNYACGFGSVAILSNTDDYQVAKKDEADWLTFTKAKNGNILVFSSYYYDNKEPRYATLTLTTPDGKFSRDIVVKQAPNTSADMMGDKKLEVAKVTASASQGGEGPERMIDNDYGTLWHSPYGGTSFPITLTFTLQTASHVDYLAYTPRTDGTNGNFHEIAVYYSLGASTTFQKAGEADFRGSNATSRFEFGENGLDNVSKIKIEVKSANNNAGVASKVFASCAEMGFYTYDNSINQGIEDYFTSPLCSELKPGITAEDIAGIPNPYLRQLANILSAGDYSTKFRVGTFGCYNTREAVRNFLKTSSPYDPYENPTGIYFNAGEQIVVFAEGVSDTHPVSLCIKSFGSQATIETEGQPESYYPLQNGANVIKAVNKGHAYVNYYSEDFENAPEVKLHFAMATEIGYFDAEKKMTNSDWVQIMARAKANNIETLDFLTKRLHVVAPYKNLVTQCPKDAEKLVLIYDSVIYYEREIMGLQQFNCEPKNHQFARPIRKGMYADGTGAAADFGSYNEWCNPNNFGFWGIAHELGHVNQITPGFKWPGCGETTNNIYAAWVEHKVGAKDRFGNGHHRLEDEYSGIDSYSGMRGGRFQAYLEEGVRKGVSWQLQDGPDYHGSKPEDVTVTDQDENGYSGSTVTTPKRNYDHFVKVVPFWQLELFTKEAKGAPEAYGKFYNSYREGFSYTDFPTSGKQQIEMMRRFCNAAQIDFCDFFEKAGLLKPIKAYIEDYSKGWLVISQEMCDNLKAEIASKGYPKAPAALNYINAYNWQNFLNKTKLQEGTVGNGCRYPDKGFVQVDNTKWPGAVGYETYNEAGELLRITMYGLGGEQMSSNVTKVLFPSDASYIMAVGYDGTKVKIYQK